MIRTSNDLFNDFSNVQLTLHITLLVHSTHTSPVFIPLVEVICHCLGSIKSRSSLAAEEGFVLGMTVVEDVKLGWTVRNWR